MEKEEWNAEDFRYLVKYRLDKPGAEWRNVTIEDPLADRAIIREQPVFEKYVVQVIAVNRIGPSIEEPRNVIGWSGEDIPVEAPRDFRVGEVLNSSNVLFLWEHIDIERIFGHFRGYKVTTILGDSEDNNFLEFVFLNLEVFRILHVMTAKQKSTIFCKTRGILLPEQNCPMIFNKLNINW